VSAAGIKPQPTSLRFAKKMNWKSGKRFVPLARSSGANSGGRSDGDLFRCLFSMKSEAGVVRLSGTVVEYVAVKASCLNSFHTRENFLVLNPKEFHEERRVEHLSPYRFLANGKWTFEDWRSSRSQQEVGRMICGQIPTSEDRRTMNRFVIDSSANIR
jgi:hypothetical protein